MNLRRISTISGIRAIDSTRELREWRRGLEAEGKTVGFVPTMGALHQGHVSLAQAANDECDEVIASIFVNPTQFAPGEDLDRYPRDLEGDISKLATVPKVSTVFHPPTDEIYPSDGVLYYVGLDSLENRLREGLSRPGHFRGVATVVSKLFNLVKPHKAYFGQKDGAQCIVIKRLVKELLFDTEIRVVPTMREPDGLAMSSRNLYLSPEERPFATTLYEALQIVQKSFAEGERRADSLLSAGIRHVEGVQAVKLLYLDLCCTETGRPYKTSEVLSRDATAMVSGAMQLGKTRLIDNLLL
mmetsp:Transcript_2401/g.3478  ORF Transcript_2401/g.3478 Transcript_2401/m.3478 type:complete len:299 (+) Transcript_2401:2-898(+)